MVGLVLTAAMVYLKQPTLATTESYLDGHKADPQRLEAHVRKLSVDFHPRSHDQTENLEKCIVYLETEFGRTSGTVSRQPFNVGEHRFANIRCFLEGTSDRRIIIGAHYVTPGADDNASGVAGLLELARLLDGFALAVDVEVVAYTLEEPPFFATKNMGSYHHAAAMVEEQQDIIGMIALEMIGYFDDTPGSQHYPMPALQLGPRRALLARAPPIGSRAAKVEVHARHVPFFIANRGHRVLRACVIFSLHQPLFAMLISCDECQQKFSDSADACPHCGWMPSWVRSRACAAANQATDSKQGRGCVLAILGLLLCLTGLIFGPLPVIVGLAMLAVGVIMAALHTRIS